MSCPKEKWKSSSQAEKRMLSVDVVFSLWLGAGRKGWKCGSEIKCRQPLFSLEDCTESVCAGDTADHWPHPTHHPVAIFRIHKQANGKRLVSIFFFFFFLMRSSLLWVSLLSFCSWIVGFISELEALSGLGGGGKGSVDKEWGVCAGHLQVLPEDLNYL